MGASPTRQTLQPEATVQLQQASLQASLAHRECLQKVEGLQAYRHALRQVGSKLPGLCLSGRSPCMVDLMNPDPSTTLADLFMPFRFGDLSSAVRASLRSWLNDEIDDGLAHGRQARLRRWTVVSFFSVPLVRDGDTGGMRKRPWS